MTNDSYYQLKAAAGSAAPAARRRGRGRDRHRRRRPRRPGAPPCRWPSAAVPAVLLEASTIGAGASGPQRRHGLGRLRRTDAAARARGRPRGGALADAAQPRGHGPDARPDRALRHPLRAGRRRGRSPPGSTTPRRWRPRSRAYNADYGMRLEFWPRERLRRDFPSPRYWDGMFDPEGFHLDPFALCRGYADAAERPGCPPVRAQPGHRRCAASAGAGGSPRPRGEVMAERLVLCQSAYPPRPAAGAGPGHPAGVHLHHRHRPADRRPCRGDPRTLRRLRQPLRHRLLPPAARRPAALGRPDQHAGAARATWPA